MSQDFWSEDIKINVWDLMQIVIYKTKKTKKEKKKKKSVYYRRMETANVQERDRNAVGLLLCIPVLTILWLTNIQ